MKNWRSISLINVDLKIISKASASRLKAVLSSIISSEQTAYIKKRSIGESKILISDILSVTNNLKIKGYLVTMDIEKAFESLDHSFLISAFKKFGFGENFIDWIKILLYKKESCVLNGGFTTKYFNLEKGARQGDPISAYLFILASEILFSLIKNDSSIKGIKVFDYVILYTAYADDSTFFLKDLASVKKLLDIFYYSKYSRLKPNFSKCEIAGIGSLKGVEVAVCGIKCVNLKVNTIKIHTIISSTWKQIS